jgi:hypothetical protein
MLTNARRRWLAGWLVPMVVAATAYVGCRESHCEEVHAWGNWAGAVATCGESYRATGDPADGVRLADAHMRREEWPEVERITGALLATPARGAAYRLRAIVERQRREIQLAAMYGSTALAIHLAENSPLDIVRDAIALAGIWWQHSAYDAALAAAGLARDVAVAAGDRRGAVFAEVSRSDSFRMLWDHEAAEAAMEAAHGHVAARCDRPWVTLKQGILLTQRPLLTFAESAFERALAEAVACENVAIAESALLNLAWIAIGQRRPDDAERFLAGIEGPALELSFGRALIAVERGELAAADALLVEAQALPSPDAEWPWALAEARAQIAEARGDDVAAELRYLEALAAIAELRPRAPDSKAFVVAAHRGVYEGLLALRARHGRWRDALAMVLQLDAGGMIAVTAAAGALSPAGLIATDGSGAARMVTTVDPRPIGVDDVLAAWRGRDLVVVVATRAGLGHRQSERVWRLHVRDGEVTGADVGVAWHALELADRLEHFAGDGEAAEALGAMLVPEGQGELHVLPVGRLGRIPLAALRRRGELVVARRPILRVLGVLPQPWRDRTWNATAVVIGDPRRDLPSAASEASLVAREQGATLHLGAEATLESLVSAASADLLHVAAHTDERRRELVLHLADGDVTPAALRARGVAPRLAVLSSCGSAAARDEGGWGSHAAALLAGGTEVVIATQRTIGDDATLDLVRRFYAAGGRRSPAAALAAAQVELARTAATSDWAYFTALAGPPELPPELVEKR